MDTTHPYEVLFYQTEGGDCPAEAFMRSLPVKVTAKIAKWIEQLEIYGPDLTRPYADTVKDKIRELRVIFSSQNYRLLYFFCGSKIIVTHGFVKKTAAIPEDEIRRAINYARDFESRMLRREIIL